MIIQPGHILHIISTKLTQIMTPEWYKVSMQNGRSIHQIKTSFVSTSNLILWQESMNPRHPMLQPHYISVPLQRQFSYQNFAIEWGSPQLALSYLRSNIAACDYIGASGWFGAFWWVYIALIDSIWDKERMIGKQIFKCLARWRWEERKGGLPKRGWMSK